MTDLEMTKLCAEAMGFVEPIYRWQEREDYLMDTASCVIAYDPLHDDAQAMELVKKFELQISGGITEWAVGSREPTFSSIENMACGKNLNRAICLCVAKMQTAK